MIHAALGLKKAHGITHIFALIHFKRDISIFIVADVIAQGVLIVNTLKFFHHHVTDHLMKFVFHIRDDFVAAQINLLHERFVIFFGFWLIEDVILLIDQIGTAKTSGTTIAIS